MPVTTIVAQVNSQTISDGTIENMVGSDNYEYIAPGHVKVFGKDAKEPEWVFWDGENLKISKEETLKELYHDIIE